MLNSVANPETRRLVRGLDPICEDLEAEAAHRALCAAYRAAAGLRREIRAGAKGTSLRRLQCALQAIEWCEQSIAGGFVVDQSGRLV